MRRRGFTLMELLIAAAMVGLVGIGFGAIYAASQQNLFTDMAGSRAQNAATVAIEHLQRRLLVGTAVTAPAVGAVGAGRIDFHTVEHVTRSPGASERIEADEAYFLANEIVNGETITVLRHRKEPAKKPPQETTLARRVISFQVSRPNLAQLEIQLIVEQPAARGRPWRIEMKTSISPRGISRTS